jgi:hypothetical protein
MNVIEKFLSALTAVLVALYLSLLIWHDELKENERSEIYL